MSDKTNTRTNKPSHLKDLALLFAIPLGIALLTAAVVYIPRLLANPEYDFIYSLCRDYRCQDVYRVNADGQIIKDETDSSDPSPFRSPATLRYYDTDSDSSRSLTLEEARRYQLNTSSKSPDGYSLSREETSSGFLFWGDYDEGWYLKSGAKKKKVYLSSSSSYYSRDIIFLGWVEK